MRVKYTIEILEEADPVAWACEEHELCARIKQAYDDQECGLDELVAFADAATLRVEPA